MEGSFTKNVVSRRELSETGSKKKYLLLLLAIGFVVYFIGLFGQFVWDDEYQLIYTPYIYSLKTIFNSFSQGILGIYYRPVFFAYLTVVRSLFGLNIVPFHFIQILMHIINSYLVLLLFMRFFKRRISLFLTLIFLVHPMNVEAITYISAAADPLFLFFGLSSFHLMTKDRLTKYDFLLGVVAILFSLLTKEVGGMILLIVIIYRALFIKKSFKSGIFFVFSSVIPYLFLRFIVAHTFFEMLNFIPIALATPYERTISVPKVIYIYLQTFFVPIHLSVAQHWVVRTITFKDFVLPLLIDFVVFVSICSVVIYKYRVRDKNFKKYLFFAFWFLISFAFYIQIFPIGMTVAERWFYLPMIGFLGFIGLVIQDVRLSPQVRKVVFYVGIGLIFLLSIRTIARNMDWLTPYQLFGHDVKINTDSFDVEINYAYELGKRGEYDRAIIHAEKATKLAPKFTASWATAASIYLKRHEYEKAIFYNKKALVLDEKNYSALYSLIHAYILNGQYLEAKKWSIHALKLFPNDAYFLISQAITEYKLGNTVEADRLAFRANQIGTSQLGSIFYHNVLPRKSIYYINYNND